MDHVGQDSTANHWAEDIQQQLVLLHQRLDAVDRRVEQRLAELRAKQEEDLMLLKALSCQLRGRAERMRT